MSKQRLLILAILLFSSSLVRSENAPSPSNAPIMLFFHASWCGPCKQMQPTIDKMKGLKYRIREIDFDKSGDLVEKYDIKNVPAYVMVTPDGKMIDKTTGKIAGATLTAFYNQALQKQGTVAQRPTGNATGNSSRGGEIARRAPLSRRPLPNSGGNRPTGTQAANRPGPSAPSGETFSNPGTQPTHAPADGSSSRGAAASGRPIDYSNFAGNAPTLPNASTERRFASDAVRVAPGGTSPFGFGIWAPPGASITSRGPAPSQGPQDPTATGTGLGFMTSTGQSASTAPVPVGNPPATTAFNRGNTIRRCPRCGRPIYFTPGYSAALARNGRANAPIDPDSDPGNLWNGSNSPSGAPVSRSSAPSVRRASGPAAYGTN